jgi:predicted ATP-grasp superfamily ATP-dependent carboligase
VTEWILVTDGEERAALAVCRGLAAAGYGVAAAAAARPAAAHWSRSVRERLRLPNPRHDAGAFADALEHAVSGDRFAVLIPGSEAALVVVSERRERLEPHVRIGLPPRDVVDRALDRVAVLQLASRVGLGPPPSLTCTNEAEALAAAERLGYPVLLKPARSVLQDGGLMRQRTSVTVGEPTALRRIVASFGTRVTVQKREDAPVLSLGGVFAGGRLLGLCTSRYRRTWPPGGGSASFTETIDPPDELVDRLEELLAELAWEGLFELEGLELADGRFASIDFNPRPYGSMILSVASGASLPALWCDHLLGKRPEPRRSRPGVHYRWEEAEARNVLWRIRRGRLREAAAILRPHRETTRALFEPRDPAPVLAWPVGLVMRAVEAFQVRTGPPSG